MVNTTLEQQIQLNTLFSSCFRIKLDNKAMQPILNKFGIEIVLKALNELLKADRHVISPYKYLYAVCKKY